MALDLRTLYAVTALTCLCLGLVLLAAAATRRFGSWLGWWGLSNMLLGAGTLLLPLVWIRPAAFSIQLANVLTLAGELVLVGSVCSFSGRAGRGMALPALGVCSVVVVLGLGAGAETTGARVAFMSACMCACDLFVCREGLRIAREEHLASARILVGTFGVTAALFAFRIGLALTGDTGSPVSVHVPIGPHQWLAAFASTFVALRSIVLLLLAAERANHRLLVASRTDALTRALNRAGLAASLARMTGTGGLRITVLAIDIDHFKVVNDSRGHQAGDDLLLALAAAAREVTGEGGIVARFGGDEFVVVFDGVDPQRGAAAGRAIQSAFARRVPALFEPRPTLSAGVAASVHADERFDAVLQRADLALYRAKSDGRNRVALDERAGAGH